MCDHYQLIQQCIDRAVAAEQSRGRFRRALHDTLPNLHRSIHLPQRDAPLHITCFVIRYIQAIPSWMQRLDEMCNAGGLDFHPLRELILHSFSQVPERQPYEHGLGSILDEAYLAHRAMEEINDMLHPLCGTPLLPMDPMVANMVVRELLGEQFARELDDICLRLGRHFDRLRLAPDSLVAMILCRQRLNETPGAWPDFARELNISLQPPVAEFATSTLH